MEMQIFKSLEENDKKFLLSNLNDIISFFMEIKNKTIETLQKQNFSIDQIIKASDYVALNANKIKIQELSEMIFFDTTKNFNIEFTREEYSIISPKSLNTDRIEEFLKNLKFNTELNSIEKEDFLNKLMLHTFKKIQHLII